jgi:Na+/H+-dicarboxylate symporter
MCKRCNKKFCKNILKSNLMLISITIGIIIGFIIGIALRLTSYENTQLALWFKLPGQLFLRSLQLLILPVIFFGVVTATSSFNIKNNARMSIACLVMTISSNICGSIIGVAGSFTFKLLNLKNELTNTSTKEKSINMDRSVYDIVSDLLRNMIPTNIFKATLFQELTQYIASVENSTLAGLNETIVKTRRIVDMPNTNVLGILVFAILIGIAAGVIKEKGEAFRSFIVSINEVVITVLRWLISLAPIGIGSLIIDAVIEIKDFQQTFKEVWIFAAVVAACCFFYSFFFQSVVVVLVTRTNPFKYFPKFIEPVILAFASTSGAVCMHRSMQICEQKIGVNPAVSRFGIPFFTTLKSDGSVIFVTLSTIFLAQLNNYSLGVSDYVLIVVMTCTICLSTPPGEYYLRLDLKLMLLLLFFFQFQVRV